MRELVSIMKFRFLFVLLFSIIIFTLNCKRKAFDKNEYAQLLREHPVTDIRNYPPKEGDWSNRVYNIDKDRISFLTRMNEIDGFDEIPIESSSVSEMKKKINFIRNSFHPKINKLFNDYVYGIYFCEKLGGTGITGFIYDNESQKPVGGFIIIDSDVIQKTANEWITFKERSVFDVSDIRLDILIEKESENTLDNALRYIILHEMGHVISNTLGITPNLRDTTSDYTDYPFFDKAWTSMDKSSFDKDIFPLRSSVTYYAPKANLLNLDKIWNEIYPTLEKTNFPTLYGATNALDHFAETFVSYVHCILDNRPWELTLSKGDKVIFRMKNRIYKMEREKEFIKKVILE